MKDRIDKLGTKNRANGIHVFQNSSNVFNYNRVYSNTRFGVVKEMKGSKKCIVNTFLLKYVECWRNMPSPNPTYPALCVFVKQNVWCGWKTM